MWDTDVGVFDSRTTSQVNWVEQIQRGSLAVRQLSIRHPDSVNQEMERILLHAELHLSRKQRPYWRTLQCLIS